MRLLILPVLACAMFVSACTNDAAQAIDRPLLQTEKAFELLAISNADLEAKNIFRLPIGDINLPTGRLIAFNENTAFTGSNAFTVSAKPGVYPVYEYWYARNGEATIGSAMTEVRFSNEHPVKWRRAIAKENYFLPDKSAGILMYDNHSRFGAFLSAEALGEIASQLKSNKDPDSYLIRYKRSGKNNAALNGIAFPIRSPRIDEVRTLRKLWKNRPYPSYFGFAADGNPVALVTTYLYLEEYL